MQKGDPGSRISPVTLERLFRDTDWTETKLAEQAEVDVSTINRLRNQQRIASLALALRIERVTEGLVGAAEVPMGDHSRRELRALRAS